MLKYRDTSGDVQLQLEDEVCCSPPNTQRRDEMCAAQ